MEKKDLKPILDSLGTFFYTTDLGQSVKLFDELKGFSIKDFGIHPSHILLITSGGNEADPVMDKYWISKRESFEPAFVPIKKPTELDRGQILLCGNMEEDLEHGKSELFPLSDSSGVNCFLGDTKIQAPFQKMYLEELDNLRGTMCGKFDFRVDLNQSKVAKMHESNFHEKINWFQKIVKFIRNNLFYKKSCPHMESFPFIGYKRFSKNKISFDYGKTWTNLKVVDPSGKHKHLFQCDIDDVEHCSFQETSYFSSVENEPAAGILMKTGVVGESVLSSEDYDEMTFISRDGGAS